MSNTIYTPSLVNEAERLSDYDLAWLTEQCNYWANMLRVAVEFGNTYALPGRRKMFAKYFVACKIHQRMKELSLV